MSSWKAGGYKIGKASGFTTSHVTVIERESILVIHTCRGRLCTKNWIRWVILGDPPTFVDPRV